MLPRYCNFLKNVDDFLLPENDDPEMKVFHVLPSSLKQS